MAPFQPHVPLFAAYTLTIARAELDAGLPAALGAIPPPFQAPLAAALACDLAHDAAQTFFPMRRAVILDRPKAQLLLRTGGRRFVTLRQERDELLDENWRLLKEERELDFMMAGCCDMRYERAPNARFGRGLFGDFVRWRYDWLPKDSVDRIRHRVDRLRRRRSLISRRLAALDAKLKNFEEEMANLPHFLQARNAASTKPLNVVVREAGLSAFSGVIAQLLREHDPEWWLRFSARFLAQVDSDTVDKPYKIAFRDQDVIAAISALLPKNQVWDGKAVTYLVDHRKEWGFKIKIALRTVQGWRNELRMDDLNSMRWLADRGYAFNFYSRWMERLLKHPQQSPWPTDNIDTDWVATHAKCLADGEFEQRLWTFNKLTWVLTPWSRKDTFQPPFLPDNLAKEWAREFSDWKEKVEQAAFDKIDGWAKARDLHPSRACESEEGAPAVESWHPLVSAWPLRRL